MIRRRAGRGGRSVSWTSGYQRQLQVILIKPHLSGPSRHAHLTERQKKVPGKVKSRQFPITICSMLVFAAFSMMEGRLL